MGGTEDRQRPYRIQNHKSSIKYKYSKCHNQEQR